MKEIKENIKALQKEILTIRSRREADAPEQEHLRKVEQALDNASYFFEQAMKTMVEPVKTGED